MLRKEFDKNLTIKVTKSGDTELSQLRVLQIKSFQPTNNGQTAIVYADANGENPEELRVQEDHEGVSALVGGYPDEETKAEMLESIVSERVEAATRNLAELDRVYARDKNQPSSWTKTRLPEVLAELKGLDARLAVQQELVQSMKAERFSLWLHKQINSRLEVSSSKQSWLTRQMQKLYKRVVSKDMAGRLYELAMIEADIEENLGFKRNLEQGVFTDQEERKAEYDVERVRLIKMRDATSDGYIDRQRLEVRIKDRQEAYGSNHYFSFVRQESGIYENVKSKEFKAGKVAEERQRAEDVSSKHTKSNEGDPKLDR